MYKVLIRYTLLWSFILGALIAVLLHRNANKNKDEKHEIVDKYEKWFKEKNLRRIPLTMDFIKYGNYNNSTLESQFLYKNIKVMCVLLIRNRKNAAAANQTWLEHCNDRYFIYLQPEKEVQKTKLPIRQTKIESSWHILCDGIRNMKVLDWTLFVNDDMFGIAENIRKMVASYDCNKGHYLGHAISFWGVEYNIAQAGYLLSKYSINLLRDYFNSTEKCAAGGRFWKQEDYYLGKHLATFGVHPTDTRDQFGKTTFHGHNLGQLLFPGSFSALSITNYYSRSVFPIDKCCSSNAVTFQTVEADKMHTNHYLIYQLQVFTQEGTLGNRRRTYNKEEDEKVWKAFVVEHSKKPLVEEISPEAYFELWKSIVNDPINFNQNIRKWNEPNSSKNTY